MRFCPCPPQLAKDLVHPSLEDEKRKHKKKRLVQSPNSYFMDVKCPGKGLRGGQEDGHAFSWGSVPPQRGGLFSKRGVRGP